MGTPSVNAVDKLKGHAFFMIFVLVAEYVLGVATTLLVKFPEGQSEKQVWQFAFQQIPLALHIIIGILLFVGSVSFFIRALKLKNRIWIVTSSVAMVAILGGMGAGSTFITSQSDLYSFIMSISLMIALISYSLGAYMTKVSTSPSK